MFNQSTINILKVLKIKILFMQFLLGIVKAQNVIDIEQGKDKRRVERKYLKKIWEIDVIFMAMWALTQEFQLIPLAKC